MFGAYGISDVYFTDLSAIKSNIDDTLVAKEVTIVENNNNNNKHKNQISWKKVLKGTDYVNFSTSCASWG